MEHWPMAEPTDNTLILQIVCGVLLKHGLNEAENLIKTKYPFAAASIQNRRYSETQKTVLFLRDGFIDRYTGKRLIFIGTLRLISFLVPDVFPYHSNWKMDSCHPAYWELSPTLDHILPIARGGLDQPDNWITASMLNNARKANWTLEELGWALLPPGNLAEWDGLISNFIQLVEADSALLDQSFIRRYYNAAKSALQKFNP
jgi:hypothetical protein